MIKKTLFFTIFMLLAVFSFAGNIPNMYIFIEGTADEKEHHKYFLQNFQKEAAAKGYIVTESREEAAHTVYFSVSPNINVFDSHGEPYFDNNKYVIKISLIRNKDNFEILNFDFFFTDLDEVYGHNSALFQNATLYIPPFTEKDYTAKNNVWKNKLIYLKASFDYPVTFYLLQKDGLDGGVALYGGSKEFGTFRSSPINNEIMAMPGFTVGCEVVPLKHLSFEVNYQLDMGNTRNNNYINMALGMELKIPIDLKYIMLVPCAAFSFPLTVSDIFAYFPPVSFGAGIQVSTGGGKSGAFFIDVKYLVTYTDAIMHNPYLAFPVWSQYYPEPAVIHYRRSALRIGVGYKIGFIDR